MTSPDVRGFPWEFIAYAQGRLYSNHRLGRRAGMGIEQMRLGWYMKQIGGLAVIRPAILPP